MTAVKDMDSISPPTNDLGVNDIFTTARGIYKNFNYDISLIHIYIEKAWYSHAVDCKDTGESVTPLFG